MDEEFYVGWKNVNYNKMKKISIIESMTLLYFCKQSCTNLASAVGFSTSLVAGGILIPFILLFLYHFFKNLYDIKWDAVILYLSCILFFYTTLKIHPEYLPRFDDVYNNGRFSAKSVFSLGAGIYTYYIIRLYEKNFLKLYTVFRKIPYILFLFNLGTIFNHSIEYGMDFGYQMEMAAILFIAQYLYEDRQKIKLVLSLISMFLGVIYGARASILGYALFIVIYIIWEHKASIKQMVLVSFGAVAAIIYSSQTIMMAIYNFILSLGIHSRTLFLIASGDVMAADTARQDRIWPVLDEIIKNSSFFEMHGAYGDRYYLAPHYPYAHNIVYEMIITFGKCLGSIFIILIILYFLKTCKKDKKEGGLLVLIFGIFSISRLAISSSFWIEPYFWAFLALLVNYNKRGSTPITDFNNDANSVCSIE